MRKIDVRFGDPIEVRRARLENATDVVVGAEVPLTVDVEALYEWVPATIVITYTDHVVAAFSDGERMALRFDNPHWRCVR